MTIDKGHCIGCGRPISNGFAFGWGSQTLFFCPHCLDVFRASFFGAPEKMQLEIIAWKREMKEAERHILAAKEHKEQAAPMIASFMRKSLKTTKVRRLCKVRGCRNKAYQLGLCKKHYHEVSQK